MSSDLMINGYDALNEWGVSMGEGFLDTLNEPLSTKDPIENESRMENGKRIFPDDAPLFKSREITLDFLLEGTSHQDFRSKKAAFLSSVYGGMVTVCVPSDSSDVYRLYYRGKGTEYGMNYQRTFCHMLLKFEEADPTDRGASSKHDVF